MRDLDAILYWSALAWFFFGYWGVATASRFYLRQFRFAHVISFSPPRFRYSDNEFVQRWAWGSVEKRFGWFCAFTGIFSFPLLLCGLAASRKRFSRNDFRYSIRNPLWAWPTWGRKQPKDVRHEGE